MDEHVPADFEPIAQALEQLSVNQAFGVPTKEGDITVIPVAEVSVALGYGRQAGRGPFQPMVIRVQDVNLMGSGNVSAKGQTEGGEEGAPEPASGEGRATGGGARGRVLPRGYIEITPKGVAFKDIVDVNRLGLAGIAMAAWAVFWISKMARSIAKSTAAAKR